MKHLAGVANIEIEVIDTMNSSSIDAFASMYLNSNRPLHSVIHNVGIIWVLSRHDSRGYESLLATNYLSTTRLFPVLKKAISIKFIHFQP